jgi:hypothetical protein
VFRPIGRHWRRLLSVRARATLLLVTWVVSVVLTVVHDDDGTASPTRHASPNPCATQERSVAPARIATSGPTLTPLCGGADDCRDPSHHHRPLARHDVTQCPFCAMLLERPAELPLFVFVPTPTVRFVGAIAPLPLSSSQRFVVALARGPPPGVVPV